MRKTFFISILFLLLLSSCKTTKPVRPMEIYKQLSDIPASAINISVMLELKELEAFVNQQVSDLLTSMGDDVLGADDDMKVKVEKSKDIRLNIQQNVINIAVPLRLFIEKDISFTKVKAEGEITLHFLTNFKITRDWDLQTSTTIDNYEWNRKPIIKLGIINLPIKSIANRVVDRSKATIAREIDQQLQENFALKEMLLPAWKKLQEPIRVSEDYDAWLKVIPEKVGMTPVITRKGKITSTLAVQTETKVILGGFEPDTTIRPLLPFSDIADASDRYQLKLKTAVPYDSIEVLAQKELIGETFTDKNRSVTIQQVEVYGQNDNIVVNTVLTGSYEGSLYLIGKPHYDEKNEVLELKDLDFELKTNNFLQKSMAWLFQKGLKRKLKENLRLPIGDKKEEWMQMIDDQLSNLDFSAHVKMDVDIDQLTISRFFIEKNALVLLVTSEGQLQLNVNKLQMPVVK